MTTYVSLIRRLIDRYPMVELFENDYACFFCDADGVYDDTWQGAEDEAFYAVHHPGCAWMEAKRLFGGSGKHQFETPEQTSQRQADQFASLRDPGPAPAPLRLVVDGTERTGP